jgi:hypothetical protein
MEGWGGFFFWTSYLLPPPPPLPDRRGRSCGHALCVSLICDMNAELTLRGKNKFFFPQRLVCIAYPLPMGMQRARAEYN